MTDFSSVDLGRFGNIYIPTEFRELLRDDMSAYPPRPPSGRVDGQHRRIKLFEPEDLRGPSRIFDRVRRGGVAVLTGPWSEILNLLGYAERKRFELVAPPSSARQGRGRPVGKKIGKLRGLALDRFAVLARGDSILNVDPTIRIPYLIEFLGDRAGSNRGSPFLVPVRTVVKLIETLERTYPIPSLEGEIVAHENVLPPRSRESIDLVGKALECLRGEMPPNPRVLDMGCGSGCLALLAAKVLADLGGRVMASDVLPEAVATTKVNVERFSSEGRVPPGAVEVASAGNLFDPVEGLRFDLIIFNAPWVVARPRSRADTATHDEGQRTVREFLAQAPGHLKERGRVILEYSDNSGLRAVENLRGIIRDVNLRTEGVFKARIQARHARRKWETVFVFVLGPIP